LQALRQVPHRAVAWGMIDVNPAKVGVDNPTPRRKEQHPFETSNESIPTHWSVPPETRGSIKRSTRTAYWRSCMTPSTEELRFTALLQAL
jgi:hypothetical protein